MNTTMLKTELVFKTARSSGSGGQHVNKVATKVDLYFNIQDSNGLNDEEKNILLNALQSRINKSGELRISCEQSRSQFRNKRLATELFFDLITNALRPKKTRKASKPSARKKALRLQNKRFQALKKKARQKVQFLKNSGLLSY